MNKRRWLCNLVGSNLAVAGLSLLWAYTSYKYDWLNVGGGGSAHAEFWISADGVVPYVALAAWVAAVCGAVVSGRNSGLSLGQWVWSSIASIVIAPAVFLAADWLLHRSFPPPPV